MIHGIVIPADDRQPLRELDVSKDGAVAGAVGGFMEAVDLPDFGVTTYVNEEGRLRQLPFNPRATFLWWYHVPEVRQRTILVGDAVIVGLPDINGADTDLPVAVRELLLTPATYSVEVRAIGDPTWYQNQATYSDYWEAMIWGMVLLERWGLAEDVRIVPVEQDSATDSGV